MSDKSKFEHWTLLQSDRLDKIRDILLLVNYAPGLSKKELFQKIREKVIHPKAYREYLNKNSRSQNESLSNLELYRQKYEWRDRTLVEYTRAAEHLRLIHDSDGKYYVVNDPNGNIKLILSENRLNQDSFSEKEKRALVPILCANPTVRYFLSWFMPKQKTPSSIKQFIHNSFGISLRENQNIKADMKGPNEVYSNGDWSPLKSLEIRWTWVMRYWTEAIGLIDEIKVQSKFADDKEHNWKLFPIKVRLGELSSNLFKNQILEHFRIQPGESLRIPIPKVLFRICVNEYISIEDAKKLLILCHENYGSEFYLEQISTAFFNKNHYERVYLKYGGYYRGFVSIRN